MGLGKSFQALGYVISLKKHCASFPKECTFKNPVLIATRARILSSWESEIRSHFFNEIRYQKVAQCDRLLQKNLHHSITGETPEVEVYLTTHNVARTCEPLQ